MNYYNILDISKNATKKEIKNAYKTLARKYHPDKCHDPELSKKFLDIQTAYEILIDENKRYEYDILSNNQKIQLYDKIKEYLTSISPKYTEIYEIVNKFYPGNEAGLQNDINNLNFKNIYNKIFSSIMINNFSNSNFDYNLNTPPWEKDNYFENENINENNNENINENKEIEIPLYNSKKSLENNIETTLDQELELELDIYGIIETNLKERYNNKYKRIKVNKKYTNSKNTYIIPTVENELIIKNEGEYDEKNNLYGDLIIRIICEEDSEFKQFNNNNIFATKYISLYDYLYGGKIEFNYLDDQIICVKFNSLIDSIPIIKIKNKGLPYFDDSQYNDEEYDEFYNCKEINFYKKSIKRGDLYLHLKIDGINDEKNDTKSKKQKKYIKKFTKNLRNKFIDIKK